MRPRLANIRAMFNFKARWTAITGKTKVKWAALTFFVSSCAGYVVGVPLEYQNKIIYEIQALVPIWMRDNLGHGLHLLAYLCVAYGMIHASHTGPQTPPVNPPNE